MTFYRTLVLAAAASATLAGPAWSQASASQSTTAGGTIFQPIALAKTSDLSFGTIVRPVSGTGTITVSQADGTRTLSGAGALLTGGVHVTPTRAAFTVTGEGGQTYTITVPASINISNTTVVGPTLAVTLTPTATTGTLSGSLGASGTQTIGVGGAVAVTSATASGAYTGAFNVTVAYN